MPNISSGTPRTLNDLPQDVRAVCTDLLDGLKSALGNNLYGIYLYGAIVFPEMKHIHDIDCHVVLRRKLSSREKSEIRRLHKEIAEEHSIAGDDLDVWYVLLDDAKKASPPGHQVYPTLFDNSWALHHAHIRAGYCIVLYGPEPEQIFRAPTWSDIMGGLEAERVFIKTHLNESPDYCILNLCRLIYSYRTKEVVVSKQAVAEWAIDNFAVWRPLIEAALRSYSGEVKEEDKQLLESETERFYRCICDRIDEVNKG